MIGFLPGTSLSKRLMGTVSILAVATGAVSTQAVAQDADTTPDSEETVVVTGVRSSYAQSADVKRNANGVVDAITAEDIGKFPDTNLAEALQRITGVSINRVNGEGSLVTVRGFGAGFNVVTFNGRTMPTADIPIIGTDGADRNADSRNFDFSNLASEGVSALEVYKTGKAILPTGGAGATINIRTFRPLDNPGFQATISAKALHDTSVGDLGDDVTPEVSGLVSWSDDNDRFGISLFGSYQKRDSAAPSASSASWNIFRTPEFLDPSNGLVTDSTVLTNTPQNDNKLVAVPRDSRYHFSEFTRERINGQLVLQFNPSDDIRLTADVLYAENTQEERRSDASNWFNRPFSEVVFDQNKPVATTIFLAEEIGGAKDYAFEQQTRAQVDTLESYGFNAEWDVRDTFTIVFDYHHSQAEVEPDGAGGRSITAVGMAAPVVVAQTLAWPSDDIPRQSITIDDSINSNGDGVLDLQDVSTQVSNLFTGRQTNEIDEFDVRAKWEVDEDSLFTFGVNYRSSTNERNLSSTRQILGDWGATNPGDVAELAPGVLKRFCTTCEFDDFDPRSRGAGRFAVRGDAEKIFAAVSPFYAAQGNTIFGTGATDETIEEDILAVFAQFDSTFEVAGRPARLSVGIRYEDTDVTSLANISVPEAIIWQSDNDFTPILSSNIQNVEVESSYDNFLPHVDFAIDLTDDVVARASYSKTIARTSFGNLSASATVGTIPGPTALGNVATGGSGNPELIPLESDNFDVSVEWYYAEDSYVSVGAFNKRVKNFVGVGQVTRNLFGLRDPSAGATGSLSGDALGLLDSIGAERTDVNLFTMAALLQSTGSPAAAEAQFLANFANGSLDQTFVDQVAADVDITGTGTDPLFDFETTQPINNEEGNIYGIEIAFQHFFGETGFGLAGSYTYVDGDIGFNVAADPGEDQFALTGLSDTANITLIYENYGFSARIAYNWRDEFLSSVNKGTGFRNPVFVEAFGQIDVAVSYDITDSLVVTFEGINLTGEDLREFGRSESNLWFAQELDARYLLGARYKF